MVFLDKLIFVSVLNKGKLTVRWGHKVVSLRQLRLSDCQKGVFKMKKIFSISIMIMLILVSMNLISLAEELDSAEVKVKVKIPVMQKLNIIEAPEITFDYPWEGAQEGQALIIEEVGKAEIISNAGWSINVNNLVQSGFKISIRNSKERFGQWKSLGGSGTSFTGEHGKQVLSWDIKIEPPIRSATSLSNKSSNQVQLSFTLTKL